MCNKIEFCGFNVVVVTPMFNDWQCIPLLAHSLECLHSQVTRLSLLIVDDGSSNPCPLKQSDFPPSISSVDIIHLGCNLGHQRAIAIGISEVVRRRRNEAVIVIDSDGEDAPMDALKLLKELTHHPDAVIVAQRRNRSESRHFKLSYRIYKLLFLALIDMNLDFGNFSAMSYQSAMRLSYMPDLWNHFSASIVKSKIPIIKVPVDRMPRWLGQSKMNFVSLVNHGLGAIATFSEVAFVRLLILSALLILCLCIFGLGIIIVRFTTALAIPGWATLALGFVTVGVLQVVAMFAVVTFLGLSARSSISIPPIKEGFAYIKSTTSMR